jgi:hypothetical protein
MEEYGYTTLKGCLKRVVPGIVCHQEAAKTLNFEDISLQSRHNLRRSLAFQTPSNKNSILILKISSKIFDYPDSSITVVLYG